MWRQHISHFHEKCGRWVKMIQKYVTSFVNDHVSIRIDSRFNLDLLNLQKSLFFEILELVYLSNSQKSKLNAFNRHHKNVYCFAVTDIAYSLWLHLSIIHQNVVWFFSYSVIYLYCQVSNLSEIVIVQAFKSNRTNF